MTIHSIECQEHSLDACICSNVFEVVEYGPYGQGRRHLAFSLEEAKKVQQDLIGSMGIMSAEIIRWSLPEKTDYDESTDVGC